MVTYVIDRNINYTDICISACKFCAFFKAPEDQTRLRCSPLTSWPRRSQETKELGGTQILLQGGLHPDMPLEYYEEMLRFMKSLGIHVHGFSPPEICHFAEPVRPLRPRGAAPADRRRSGLHPRRRGRDPYRPGAAGHRPRANARPTSGSQVMEEAHNQGLRTTATMMFGHIETMAERLEHLQPGPRSCRTGPAASPPLSPGLSSRTIPPWPSRSRSPKTTGLRLSAHAGPLPDLPGQHR